METLVCQTTKKPLAYRFRRRFPIQDSLSNLCFQHRSKLISVKDEQNLKLIHVSAGEGSCGKVKLLNSDPIRSISITVVDDCFSDRKRLSAFQLKTPSGLNARLTSLQYRQFLFPTLSSASHIMDPRLLREPNEAWRPFVRLDRWGPVNTVMVR
jgi:hypothetical protein